MLYRSHDRKDWQIEGVARVRSIKQIRIAVRPSVLDPSADAEYWLCGYDASSSFRSMYCVAVATSTYTANHSAEALCLCS